MTTQQKHYIIMIGILIYASITWWIFFLSIGAHEYDGDAIFYAYNAASLTRSFQAAPLLIKPNWNNFVHNDRNIAEPFCLVNPGYNLMLASFYKIIGQCRLWYASLLSYVFYIFGSVFLILLLNQLFPKNLLFTSILIFSNLLLVWTMIRPLSDPIFWGLTMFLIWYAFNYSQKHISIGMLIGFIFFMRAQAIFLYPLILILIVQSLRVKELLLVVFKIVIGSIPFLLLFKLTQIWTGPSGHYEPSFYFTTWTKYILSINLHKYLLNINTSIKYLSSMNVLTPVFWVLVPSIFYPAQHHFIYRLRWFTLLGILLLILFFSMAINPSSRYYIMFTPFIIVLAYDFSCSLANSFIHHKKLIHAVIIFFFLCSNSSGFLNLIKNSSNMSFTKNVDYYDWKPVETYLKTFSHDAIIATQSHADLLLLHESRNIIILPESSSEFLNNSVRNNKIDGIVFILNKFKSGAKDKNDYFLCDHYRSWKELLKMDNIVDKSGNIFTKEYFQKGKIIQVIVYKKQFDKSNMNHSGQE